MLLCVSDAKSQPRRLLGWLLISENDSRHFVVEGQFT